MAANTKVVVRWFDGYLEDFECQDVRFGSDMLWMRLSSGQNRHVPVRQVRWYSVTPESHERFQADCQTFYKEAEVPLITINQMNWLIGLIKSLDSFTDDQKTNLIDNIKWTKLKEKHVSEFNKGRTTEKTEGGT